MNFFMVKKRIIIAFYLQFIDIYLLKYLYAILYNRIFVK